jgi:hypothetical protein
MGRGRQKAKQAKVARELKYNSGSTDFDALQAELSSARPNPESGSDFEGDIEPDYSAWIDDEDEEDEEDEDQ